MGLKQLVKSLFPKVPKNIEDITGDELRDKGLYIHAYCYDFKKSQENYQKMKAEIATYRFL